MSAERNVSPDEYELLSAYLDDMLTEAERTALEARLAGDDALRAELDALRSTVSLIKSLPVLKAPRNFTLTPEMVKSKTEPSVPSMVKSRTEPSSPNMSKSRTEPGRIIRFPISTAMSAAASFMFIIIGLLLLTSGQMSPNATPPINRAVENMDVAMQQEQADMMLASAQMITEETIEQELAEMDASSQRAMSTKTLASVTGMMPMPTPTLSAMAQPHQPQMPAPMMMDMTATMSVESLAEVVPAVAFAPTVDVVPEVMDVPPIDDVAQDAMTDMTIMSMVTSPEITPVDGVIEILGNAIQPIGTVEVMLDDVQQPSDVTALSFTPTPDIPIVTTASDNMQSINMTALIGISLIIIGVMVFIISLWRWRKG